VDSRRPGDEIEGTTRPDETIGPDPTAEPAPSDAFPAGPDATDRSQSTPRRADTSAPDTTVGGSAATDAVSTSDSAAPSDSVAPSDSAGTSDRHSAGRVTSGGRPRRRALVGLLVIVAVVAFVGVGLVASGAAPSVGQTAAAGSATGKLCTDVAAQTGLTFTGAYGPGYPVLDEFGGMMQSNMGNGAAVGDYNGDGYLDVLLLGQAGQHTKLFRNDPGPNGTRKFTDVTDQAGLGNVTSNARAAQFVDLTGSGRPDIVIASDWWPNTPISAGGPSQIFRNNGDGTFTDVTAGSGFTPTGYLVGGMTFADYDGDGLPDIYLSYWTDEAAADPGRTEIKGAFPGTNRLYRNLGNFHFQDVTDTAFIEPYHADSFTAVFADFTGDGKPDIYQANDHRPDRFYRNNGDGTFTDPGYADGLTRAGNSMGVATNVMPGGGLQLFITNITDPSGLYGSNIGNTLMTDTQSSGAIQFSNGASAAGVVDTAWGWGTAFVDMNLDGAPDLFAVQGMHQFVGDKSPHLADATSTLFLNDGTGAHFTAAGAGTGCDLPGDQRSLVVFDYDRDGAPDLLVTQVNGPTLLLRNGTTGKHWLTVAPADTGGADPGIDARITVSSGGHSTTQLLLAGGSYLAGPPREAYFGLGDAATADTVTVDWANGKQTVLKNVAANQVLRVTRP
jgi:hypothetical protein